MCWEADGGGQGQRMLFVRGRMVVSLTQMKGGRQPRTPTPTLGTLCTPFPSSECARLTLNENLERSPVARLFVKAAPADVKSVGPNTRQNPCRKPSGVCHITSGRPIPGVAMTATLTSIVLARVLRPKRVPATPRLRGCGGQTKECETPRGPRCLKSTVQLVLLQSQENC
jgi:hypothetical protein